MIHGDVFRSPQHLNLFSAFVGSGAQVFATVLLLLVCVLIGVFKATKRGALLTAVILIYAICGVIGGIVAGRIFKQLKGKNWVWNVVLTASVFPVPLGIVFTWVNTIAWNRESTAALPFTTIVVSPRSTDTTSYREFFLFLLSPKESLPSSSSSSFFFTVSLQLMMAIFLFVHFPLTVAGAIVGRNITSEFKPPCRTNKVPREVIEIQPPVIRLRRSVTVANTFTLLFLLFSQVPNVQYWYRHPLAQLFMAGFLPFSAIYIELHYIFASIWGHKIYTLFGILFLAFIMLVIVTSFITIALCYFQLAREDHMWWWSSLINGGATGLFIFAYSFFYFFHRSNMNGVLQLSFYFGYTGIVSYAFFMMLGFVGFISAFTFVDYIYSAVKTD